MTCYWTSAERKYVKSKFPCLQDPAILLVSNHLFQRVSDQSCERTLPEIMWLASYVGRSLKSGCCKLSSERTICNTSTQYIRSFKIKICPFQTQVSTQNPFPNICATVFRFKFTRFQMNSAKFDNSETLWKKLQFWRRKTQIQNHVCGDFTFFQAIKTCKSSKFQAFREFQPF